MASVVSSRAASTTWTAAKAVRFWLFAFAALVGFMVLVGGATRLTESGLSITQWKPLTGVVPPLSEADWLAEFEGYKQIPQFHLMRPDMTLGEFKSIFWWEWGHRLLARLIGLAFILPALAFWRLGALKGAVGRWVVAATGFLALEPIVGWWMVSSGLADRVEVAPQRLALHLLIAAATMGATLSAAEATFARPAGRQSSSVGAGLFALLVFGQLGLGALAAGLRAGLIDQTWPLMEGQWIPGSAFPEGGTIASMVGDAATAQFDHRLGAYVVALAALGLALGSRFLGSSDAEPIRRTTLIAALALAQVALGVATLLSGVSIGVALAHQALAIALFSAAVWNWRRSVRTA